MDASRIKKIHDQAYRRALAYRDREDAEEIANDLVAEFIELGQPKFFPIRRRVIDAIRIHTGRKDSPNYQVRKNLEYASEASEGIAALADPKNLMRKIEALDEVENYKEVLTPIESCILTLFTIWGFTHEEIAECFGFNPSRVSQILSEIKR